MTPEEFVALVIEGKVVAETGGLQDGVYATWLAPISPSDTEGVVAEAFAQGVYSPETPWEDALSEIERLLA